MSEHITLRGFLATEVTERVGPECKVASFRVGCSHRKFNKDTQSWETANTNWFTVNCFRSLATGVATSLSKGQPVVVTGKLKQKNWENKDGQRRTSWEVDAESVGHDLVFGSSTFTRTTYPQNHAENPGTETAEAVTAGAGSAWARAEAS